ncbi:hypothetical protein HYV74_00555 [Candidatus Uhrbacteria bacterium]|nr:hypothetical protein [Candidatus Uhrbacteria bacterium]
MQHPKGVLLPFRIMRRALRGGFRWLPWSAFVGIAVIGGMLAVRARLQAARPRAQMRVLAPPAVPIVSSAALEQPVSVATVAAALRRGALAGTLPIADVTLDASASDWGAVVLLPQLHRYPGSVSADAVNDRAVRAQRQTYDILRGLLRQWPIELMMVEGELAGPVSREKRDRTAQRIAARAEMVRVQDALRIVITQTEDEEARSRLEQFARTIPAALVRADRAIALDGAPYQLWAEGQSLTMVGAERAATRATSADLVRTQVYLQDRLAALTGSDRIVPTTPMTTLLADTSARTNLLRAYLQARTQRAPGSGKAGSISASSMRDPALAPYAQQLQRALVMLEDAESASSDGQVRAPSRAANPYLRIQDPRTIRRMLEENESAITQTVLEQRNGETAEYMAQALRVQGGGVGMLQYGAAHAPGLARALRAQGLTVLTVTPDEVAQRMQEPDASTRRP